MVTAAALTLTTAGASLATPRPYVAFGHAKHVMSGHVMHRPVVHRYSVHRRVVHKLAGIAAVIPPVAPTPVEPAANTPPPSPTIFHDAAAWYLQGGQSDAGPSIVALGADRTSLGLFGKGVDNQLYWRRTGPAADPWVALGGAISSSPSCVSRYDSGDFVDCFARGTDNALWELRLKDGEVAGPWSNLGGQLASAPTVVAAEGGVGVVALGAAGTLWGMTGAKPQIVGADYVWSPWSEIGHTGPVALLQRPGCASWNNQLLTIDCLAPTAGGLAEVSPFVFVGDSSNHFLQSIPIVTPYPPAYVGPALLFAYSDAAGLKIVTQLSANSLTYPSTNLGGFPASGPGCVARGNGKTRFACAVRRANGAIWVREFQLAP